MGSLFYIERRETMSVELVIIDDSGHAGFGVTAGKRTPDGSMYEWEFNDAVRRVFEKEITKFKNVITYCVSDPTGKWDVPLATRTNRANAIFRKYKSKVDAGKAVVIYISWHANAFGSSWNSANGIETFILRRGLPVAEELAEKVQATIVKETGRRNRGVKLSAFWVLKHTIMPAILIECGFMTNKEEAALLKSAGYRNKVALATVKALVSMFNLKPKEGASVAQNKEDLSKVWGAASIRKVIDQGIIPGYSDGTWRPNDPIKRAEMAVILDRLGLLNKK